MLCLGIIVATVVLEHVCHLCLDFVPWWVKSKHDYVGVVAFKILLWHGDQGRSWLRIAFKGGVNQYYHFPFPLEHKHILFSIVNSFFVKLSGSSKQQMTCWHIKHIISHLIIIEFTIKKKKEELDRFHSPQNQLLDLSNPLYMDKCI